jgi:hypothetical protein
MAERIAISQHWFETRQRIHQCCSALWLGVPAIHKHTYVCVCVCAAAVLSNGHYGLSGTNSAGRHTRHRSVNEILHKTLYTTGAQAQPEPVGLFGASDRHPDGLAATEQRQANGPIHFACFSHLVK